MSFAGTVNATQSVRRLRQQLNVPNVRPLQEDLYATNLAINAIQNSSIGDFGPPVADLTLNGYRLIDIADPIDDTDAVSKKYLASQLQPIEADLAGVKSTVAGIQVGGSGTVDTAARDAIGWPYNHAQSLDVRTGANFNDVAILKGQLGLPYVSSHSVEFRLNHLEAGATDNFAREAIGASYDVTERGSILQVLDMTATDIATEKGRMNNLNTAVGMPYVGDPIMARLVELERRATLLEERADILNRRTSYFVGQGMVRVGDVGGSGTSTVALSVSGSITSATKTFINQNSNMQITLNWADPGFNVIPLITWFNDTTGTFTDSINNDLAPIWLSANQLTRTQCKIYLEETVGATQNLRLFVILYRNDQTLLIN